MSMSVDEIYNVVYLYSNPAWSDSGTVPSTLITNITALLPGYSSRLHENITILNSKYASATDGVFGGLLYVPDLDATDPCVATLAPYLPARVVHQCNLPPTNFNLIALAPWVSAQCTRTLIASARTDPARAFIFYQPNLSADKPPSASSSDWDLQDEGHWKTMTRFPVLAVPGLYGADLMEQLSLYSGNLTEVPYGVNISTAYHADPDDYVRIFTQITMRQQSTLPGIWAFFLIVIGVLIAVIVSMSLLMHFVQARRRISLRRRVLQGEINLEGMGIARITVPPPDIEKFPLFTYHYEPEPAAEPESDDRHPRQQTGAPTDHSRVESVAATPSPALPMSEKGPNSAFDSSATATATATSYQPACAICLEEYVNRATIIRELPCGHIFHPDCIDEYLGECSSLCPLCKTSMLPEGYCPKITNVMVRRERAIRRLRSRVEIDEDGGSARYGGMMHSLGRPFRRIIFGAEGNSGRASATPPVGLQIQPQPPLPPPPPPPDRGPGSPEPVQRIESTASGRVPARERMRELAGSGSGEENHRSSRLQLMRQKVFPGF